MASDVTGILDEAYLRLHVTGPEFDGWLSNHGPMAAEAMARRGPAQEVHRWLDSYMDGLEEFPRGMGAIGSQWREALGDHRRIADWTTYFRDEMTEQPWRDVLGTWWPRLLPGVAAAGEDQISSWLAGLADAAVLRYLAAGQPNPVMLVHSATAPTAILRSLPALHRDPWKPSAAAAARAIALVPRRT